ncbi:MAG: twin-arginine translocation pathway signal [Cyanobacteriota bacterium]|nr:twin-arginine translocation pathway signal [Cyanobacteriota bacterium]
MDPAAPAPALLLRRRRLLGLGGAAALSLLPGCRGAAGPELLAVRGELPGGWLRALPDPWHHRSVAEAPELLAATATADLLALGDGWAASLGPERLQPFGAAAVLARLAPAAAAASRLFQPDGPVLAFPWAVDPWLLVLRGRADLAARRAEGLALLLDPSLRGRLVLPASPRVVISLAGGGDDPQRLRALRAQAVAANDRDALQLLLNGDAEAAVVPRQPMVPLLRRDPRLQALLLPGAPLNWNLLLRPASSREPAPRAWLERLLSPPLLPRVLAAGWVPPLPRPALEAALAGFAASQRALLLPEDDLGASGVSLPPLDAAERRRLAALWTSTAPER